MNLGFDLKYAWRLLKKSWGYSLMCATVVALSVGLAIWANAGAYSQLLQPLGIPGSESWYNIQMASDAAALPRPTTVDAYTYQEILKQNRSGDYIGAYAPRRVVLSEGQASTSLRGVEISPRLLSQMKIGMGRMFQEADARPDAPAVAIITDDAWQNYFAGDPNIVGKTARVDSAPVQIIGVLPKRFWVFQDFEIWRPLQLANLARPGDSTLVFSPFVVPLKGKSLNDVTAEVKSAVDRVNADYPERFKAKRHAMLIPANRMFTYTATAIVAMIIAMSAAVLLLGGVNISMVFLTRLLERSRELALRSAVGASRPRLLRQCLIETSSIVVAGLVVAFGLAYLGVRWFQWTVTTLATILASGRVESMMELKTFDAVSAMMFGIAIWLLSTLVPAWRVAKQDAVTVLAGSGKGASNRGSNRSASILVGLQVVISSAVLVVCSSMVFAVHKEVSKPSGMETSSMMISTMPTAFTSQYSEPTQRLRYWEDMVRAIQTRIPGSQVAIATAAPSRPRPISALIEGQQQSRREGGLTLPYAAVSDNYFSLLGLRLRAGRLFDSTDQQSSLKVAVIDDELATRYWPGQDPLGKRIQLNPADNGPFVTVVGVVSAVAGGRPYRKEDIGVVYQPLRQAVPSQFSVLAKVPNTSGNTRVTLRAAAYSVDRDLPLNNVQTLDDYQSALKMPNEALITPITAIALITVIIAASGLFGLISRSVAQRTQEVGIRRALGASPRNIISIFLRQGAIYLGMAFVGIIIGIIVMPVMSREITNILDYAFPVTLGVIFLMAGIIFSASYLPSRRAVILEPSDALRYE